MSCHKIIFLLVLAGFTNAVFAQQPLSLIDRERISQPKVTKLLSKENLLSTKDLKKLKASCYNAVDSSQYCYHQKNFLIKAGIDRVWETYKSVRPEQAWRGKIGSFAFMYSRLSNELTYLHDRYDGIEEGQIIFLNLQLLGGLINLAVGHEVKSIDEDSKYIRFCYLANGKSNGSQAVQFSETEEGYTMVSHQTRYKSGSEFRDEKLYPLIHGLIISEYHRNVRSIIEAHEI